MSGASDATAAGEIGCLVAYISIIFSGDNSRYMYIASDATVQI